MAWHSKAPFRIGLAGGGTDVSPYCDLFGGAVLNATISLYAHARMEIITGDLIILEALDTNEKQVFEFATYLPFDGHLNLLKAVYNRISRDHKFPATGFRLSTFVDVPAGSGLGTSSTLVVAILGVFKEMLQLSLTNYEIAQYAWDIERIDLQFSGGRQDQYAATFGGFNFLEFFMNDSVAVTSLPLPAETIKTLQENLLLYYTATNRNSAHIIDDQVKNVSGNNAAAINAMHHLKEQAYLMKELLLNGDPDKLGSLLHFGFTHKKNMAANISNPTIDAIYAAALTGGATGGKISGAGGGGFMVFYCPGDTRRRVGRELAAFGGEVKEFSFVTEGLQTWDESIPATHRDLPGL